jgi:hypothetical protein
MTMTTIVAVAGGHCAPPLQSFPSRRTPLVVVDVSDHSRWWQHKGFWGVGVRVVEEDEVGAIALVCQVPILPEVDDGGKRSGVTLVGLCGCQRQAGEGEEEALRHEGDDPDNDGYR